MPFTVKIRGVEIVCNTLDELDELIRHFGIEGPSSHSPSMEHRPIKGDGGGQPLARDVALLQAFVEGGRKGVPSGTVTEMLGAGGKGVPGALDKWSSRINLAPDGQFPFERISSEGRRGWRLTEGSLAAAKLMVRR